ncbi:hypothetical protein V8E36_006539 [Tilletia maclaganii]
MASMQVSSRSQGGGPASTPSGHPGGCPHLATDSENRLINLTLDPASTTSERPLLKDVLHRFAAGVRWAKKIRNGHVRPEEDDDDPDAAAPRAGLDLDDKTALKRRKLLPHPTCVQCGLILHRPFVCLTCACQACFYHEYGSAASAGLLNPSSSGSGESAGDPTVLQKVEQECHIAAHLEASQHPLAFDMHRGTVFCRQCDDVVYDSRFEQVYDLEVSMAAASHRLKGKRAKHLDVCSEASAQAMTPVTPVPRGLRNMGATCWMNVVLQSFLHNPLLRNYFLSDRHNTKLCAARENCLACEMDKIFAEFYNPASSAAEYDLAMLTPMEQPLTNGAVTSEPSAPVSAHALVPISNGSSYPPLTPYGPATFLITIWLGRESAELSQAGQQDAHELFISTLNGLHASLMAPSSSWTGSSRSPQRGGAGRGSVSATSGASVSGGSTLSRPRARSRRLPTFPAEDRTILPRRWDQVEEVPQDGLYPSDKKKIAAVGEKRKRAHHDDEEEEDDEDEDDDLGDDDEEEEYFVHPAFTSSSLASLPNGDDYGGGPSLHPPLTPGLSGLNANACPCVVHRIFGGTIQSDVTCLQCKSTNSTRDPMLDLSLDLRSTRNSGGGDGGGNGKVGKNGGAAAANGKKKTAAGWNANKKKWGKKGGDDASEVGDGSSALDGLGASAGVVGLGDDEQHLLTCLERYCSPEALGPQQYTCAQCGSQGGATKQLSLYRLPPVLCIQLKRFEHEHKNGSSGSIKIDVRVRFSLSLDLRDFVTPSVQGQAKGVHEDPEAYIYDLFNVIVHEGSMNTGHYTNFCKRKDGWYRFNDDKTTPATIVEVLSARAYQLCYIRRQLYNVRPDTIHLAQV